VLDLPRMRRITLSPRPRLQRFVGHLILGPNYNLPPRVRITFEGEERVPSEPVIYAMNHTDRYNYWPFQYRLWRRFPRFTATWVKGKYYENELVARFMEWTNNIPTVSRGYLITRDFLNASGRRPTDEEYEHLRGLVDGAIAARAGEAVEAPAPPPASLDALLTTPRDMLGRPFAPANEGYGDAVVEVFGLMMERFVELNREAFGLGLDLLVFPQGTRSKRLSRGHIGLAQIAMAFDRTIVPVGCNGSDRCYPGSTPLARGGHIVYRFGEPIRPAELAAFKPDVPYVPFSPAAEARHRERFQGAVDVVMDRINELLDPEYQFSEDRTSEGVTGSRRFV